MSRSSVSNRSKPTIIVKDFWPKVRDYSVQNTVNTPEISTSISVPPPTRCSNGDVTEKHQINIQLSVSDSLHVISLILVTGLVPVVQVDGYTVHDYEKRQNHQSSGKWYQSNINSISDFSSGVSPPTKCNNGIQGYSSFGLMGLDGTDNGIRISMHVLLAHLVCRVLRTLYFRIPGPAHDKKKKHSL